MDRKGIQHGVELKRSLLLFFLICISDCFFISNETFNGNVEASVIIVDAEGNGDFITVQDAINNAQSGDTIYVTNGIFNESIIVNRTVNIIGDGIENTNFIGNNNIHVIHITADNVSISNLSVTNVSNEWPNAGIYVDRVNGARITNVEFDGCGLYAEQSERSIFTRNQLNNAIHGIGMQLANSDFISLSNNSMLNCGLSGGGPHLSNWISHSIDGTNTVNGRTLCYLANENNFVMNDEAGQIIIANCSSVQITDQNCSDTVVGISVYKSERINISNVTCNNNSFDGISIVGYNNSIKGNICMSNDWNGIYVSGDNNQIDINKCSQNGRNGMEIKGNQNIISHNTLNNNIQSGLYLPSSNNDIVNNNSIFQNGLAGLDFQYSANNMIYHNNFINNTQQVIISELNIWQNIQEEGNYWSDYNGLDNGNHERIPEDGIGDTMLPHNNLDNYPFIYPWGWLYPMRPILNSPDSTDSKSYNISWISMRANGYILEESTSASFSDATEYILDDNYKYIVQAHNGTYYYRCKSFNEKHESEWSEILKVTIDLVPTDIIYLNVTSDPNGNALNITWKFMDDDDILAYHLYCRTPGYSSMDLLKNISSSISSYYHSNLTDGGHYHYAIQAMDATGQLSSLTNEVIGIPYDITPPDVPRNLEVKKAKKTEITITWKGSIAEDLVGYLIYRSSNSDGPFIPIGHVSAEYMTFIDNHLNVTSTYYYLLTAYDEVPNESNPSEKVIGKTQRGRHVFLGMRINDNLTLKEDTVDNSSINLNEWFYNIKGEDLNYSVEDNKHINVDIQSEGPAVLSPEPDWNGVEQITFVASDGLFEVSWSINVTVKGVNDPPGLVTIIKPSVDTVIQRNRIVDFIASCDDPDVVYGDVLEFSWKSNITGSIGKGPELENIVLTPGYHLITLTVSDQVGLLSIATVNITIEGADAKADDTTNTGNDGQSGKSSASLMQSAVIAVVVAVLVAVLFLILFIKPKLLMKRRKQKPDSPPETIQETKDSLTRKPAIMKGKITTTAQALKILEFNESATQNEIKERYRKIVEENHQDKVAAMDEEFRELAEKRTKSINEAYRFLIGDKPEGINIGGVNYQPLEGLVVD